MKFRRVTRACAQADWKPAGSHDEVVDANGGNHLLSRFLEDATLDACHHSGNRMDRARDCAGPGPRRIGNFHIKAPEARRAWLWRDTGEFDPFGSEHTIDWMIAEGPRRQGDRTDLQHSHIHVLCDPDDTWVPTGNDYEDLAAAHDNGWLDRALLAVAAAAEHAELHRNELVQVNLAEVNAGVTQEEGVPIGVTATVVQEYSDRWFFIERLWADGRVLSYEEAAALAFAAFEDVDDCDIEEIFMETAILDDRFVIRPAIHYAWCATV